MYLSQTRMAPLYDPRAFCVLQHPVTANWTLSNLEGFKLSGSNELVWLTSMRLSQRATTLPCLRLLILKY